METREHVGLARTTGFLAADARGRVVGRVEGFMYGASTEMPDALSVRLSPLRWRRRLVPAGAIAAIEERTKVIGLRIERTALRAFV
jgi:hypothetical protein